MTPRGNGAIVTIQDAAAGENERLAALTSMLRQSIRTARVALDAIRSGRVGIAGSTGAVLDRSLVDASDLIDRLIDAKLLETRPGRMKVRAKA